MLRHCNNTQMETLPWLESEMGSQQAWAETRERQEWAEARFESSRLAREWQRLENRIAVTELRLENARRQRVSPSHLELKRLDPLADGEENTVIKNASQNPQSN